MDCVEQVWKRVRVGETESAIRPAVPVLNSVETGLDTQGSCNSLSGLASPWAHEDSARRKMAVAGFDVNEADANGMTPLEVACFYGSIAVLQLLLDRITIKCL